MDTSAEHVKELEDELLKLRIENAYLKIEEAAFRGGNSSEKTARIVHSLRGQFKLKDILAVVGFPKATYMYWQKRFDRENPDKQLEDEITKIHIENKDYGYRRVYRNYETERFFVNKKESSKNHAKLCFQVTSFTRKSRRYNSYKGNVGKIAPNRINRRFNTSVPHQKDNY